MLPSRLLVRTGVVVGVRFDDEAAPCLGVGSKLLRRLFATLEGREVRRAIGLSSSPAVVSSSSAIAACRAEAGVEDRGVDRIGVLPLAGVAGDCIGLANRRLGAWRTGVVDAGRLGG
jgi:hypothetical protein